MSTEQQRAEWRELAAAATPGEWERSHNVDMPADPDDPEQWSGEYAYRQGRGEGPTHIGTYGEVSRKAQADAAFIAAARTAIPALLADVDALTAMLEREMLRRQDAESDILRLTESDTPGPFELTSSLRAERDALAAELATVREAANVEWQAEHAARLVAEERLKAATVRADALQAELATVDEYGVYCYGAIDGRWRMSFTEWQEAVKDDAQPQV